MKIMTILMSLMISTLSFAGRGEGHSHDHDHGHGHGHENAKKNQKVDAIKAEELARTKVRVLAFQEKIIESWNDAKLASAEIKEFEDKKEWLVTFSNEKGIKGKVLYVFLKLDGEFVAANFTGK
jgi:hypothetical protein